MKKFHKNITSYVLISTYLLIVCTPLAPFAMKSKLIAHAVTGECTGDCRIDGCSTARSANHTCCCWQKKLRGGGDHRGKGECCIPPTVQHTEAPKKSEDCCAVKTHKSDEHDVDTDSSSEFSSPTKGITTIGCSPCGSGKLLALLNVETIHHLPFFFTEKISTPMQTDLSLITPDPMISRIGDPPDPPPIISNIT